MDVDVAIVGAGYTGLWTAYYLKLAQPSLQIVLLEREVAGFGASGRNGGWVSGFLELLAWLVSIIRRGATPARASSAEAAATLAGS